MHKSSCSPHGYLPRSNPACIILTVVSHRCSKAARGNWLAMIFGCNLGTEVSPEQSVTRSSQSPEPQSVSRSPEAVSRPVDVDELLVSLLHVGVVAGCIYSPGVPQDLRSVNVSHPCYDGLIHQQSSDGLLAPAELIEHELFVCIFAQRILSKFHITIVLSYQ